MRVYWLLPIAVFTVVSWGCPKRANPDALDFSEGLTEGGKKVSVLSDYEKMDKCTVVASRQDENTFCEGIPEQEAIDNFMVALRNDGGAKGASHIYIDMLVRGFAKGKFCAAKVIDSLLLNCAALPK